RPDRSGLDRPGGPLAPRAPARGASGTPGPLSTGGPRALELGDRGSEARRPLRAPRTGGAAVTGGTRDGGGRPIPQRLVIVAPTSVRWDSRTHRIAASVAARGHDVVVLARADAGLPLEEAHPAGYRIRRVDVAALAGLPIPAPARRLAVRAWARRRLASEASPQG